MQQNTMSTYMPVLARTGLFAGLTPREISDMLPCLRPRPVQYGQGETVLWEGEPVEEIGIVTAGQARSVKTDYSGRTVIVTLLGEGSYIGVLLAASHSRLSPVSVEALTPLTVLFFPLVSLIRRCPKACQRHDRLLLNILDGIAEKALILHDRNDCLIRPTVREKVLIYLTRVAKEKKNRAFVIPLDRSAMAEYLNVDRSALSRELSRMHRDGLIDFYKNHFTLLNPQE